MLFNLSEDISEKNNVAEQNPELVAKLKLRMTQLDSEIHRKCEITLV